MHRKFSPLIGLLVAATLMAVVPAAFAAVPDHLPFRDSPPPAASSAPDAGPVVGLPSSAAAPAPILSTDSEPVAPRSPHVETDRPPTPADLTPPGVPHEIKARCFGSVDDTGAGSVECNWTIRDDAAIAGWQLWNIRIRPDHGERNLVAELGADVTTYLDTAVEVPGRYLYVVLGLDADGAIIARSAVAPAGLVAPPAHDDPMRLKCRVTGPTDVAPEIGCEWSPTKVETAVGYVLWRIVDGGDRGAVARTGLDVTRFVDTEVAAGHRYVYAITAVDATGEVVGRSRAEHVDIPGPRPRPVPPVDIRPLPPVSDAPIPAVDAPPVDVAPARPGHRVDRPQAPGSPGRRAHPPAPDPVRAS